MTDGTTASIFQQLIPILTALLATALRLEPRPECNARGFAKVGGIIAGAAGAATVVLSGKAHSDSGSGATQSWLHGLGEVLLFGNTTSMAIYLLLQKHWVFDHEWAAGSRGGGTLSAGALARWSKRPISLAAWTYFLASCLLAVVVIISTAISPTFAPDPAHPHDRIPRLHVARSVVIPLAYAALVSSFLAYAALTWANKHLPASFVASLWPVQVVTVAFLAFMLLGETPSAGEALGATLVVAGLLSVLWAGAQHLPRAGADDDGDAEEHSLLGRSEAERGPTHAGDKRHS